MARVLIVGFGSIGRRHYDNLKTLGTQVVEVCDTDPQKRDDAARRGVRAFSHLEEALASRPEVVFVATPPSSHLTIALAAAQAGCHLFIEKPLAHTEEYLDELVQVVKQKQLVTMMGCNMRFHFGPATIKRLLEEGAIGTIISASLDAGMYLPDWHPELDYRQAYSARWVLGGGVILDGIHEIDYARWLFGEVREVFCHGGRLSHLEIDTEDSANIVMVMAAGFSVVVHIDYVQRAYARSCKVIGEQGTVQWDITSGLRWFCVKTKTWLVIPQPEPYSINEMYVEELRHFLRCVEQTRQPILPIEEAVRVTRVVLAIKRSMDTQEKVVI